MLDTMQNLRRLRTGIDMEQYMIFFDIDGTLLDNESGIVPESTIRALHQAKKNGHMIFLCTGRCRAIWPGEIVDIGFDGMVAGCGTTVYYHGEKILHARLEQSLQRQIAEDMVKCHVDGVLEGEDYCYFSKDRFLPVIHQIYKDNGKFFGKDCQRIFQEEESLYYDKFTLWFDETGDIEGFKAKYEKDFEFILRDPTFYEIVPKAYSKATGIELLCEKTGIDREHTIGVGDSTNDLAMLQYTGISIAMGSGDPALFPQVDYVTGGVAEDGIEQALRKYNII